MRIQLHKVDETLTALGLFPQLFFHLPCLQRLKAAFVYNYNKLISAVLFYANDSPPFFSSLL